MAKARSWGRHRFQPPQGRVRRSQVVTTYGPGALVDLVDQAVLIGGLDFWSWDLASGTKESIQEPRLRDALAQKFQDIGRSLSLEHPFFEPPAGNEREPSRHAGIQALEFPRWFVCQNPGCRALLRKEGLVLQRKRYRHHCDDRKRAAECVPVRFVGACTRGHVEDYPWIPFVHGAHGKSRCAAPSLRLEEGATGDFSEIRVRCVCGAQRPLAQALAPELRMPCQGERPWLGSEAREECEEKLRLLVRTASHAYFSQTVSALSVPEVGRELEQKVREVWDVLKAATVENLTAFRSIPKVGIALKNFRDAEVLASIEGIKRGAPAVREPLRTAEFRQFTSSKPESAGDLAGPDDTFFARQVRPAVGLPDGISNLVLASKLREVRAQIGFTRLEAVTPDLQGEFDLEVRSAMLGLQTDWLPATEIRGEGVFLQLDEAEVSRWERRPAVLERGKELLEGYDAWAAPFAKAPPFPGVRFYLLHSLAHLLVTAISLECGYAASAIRERIYCSRAGEEPPMAAILLATGSSGTEGTLGGLVEQGRAIGAHLERAVRAGQLCSNDPVCAGHSPSGDPTERFLEGAACHGCLFVAESSCERFNRLLDRALVVPTIGHDAELAYFGGSR